MGEMETFLKDPNLQAYLESINIQTEDARMLFRMLDLDDSGFVSIEEFCEGCLRFMGEAKSFDIHCIMFENKRLMNKLRFFTARMENFIDILTGQRTGINEPEAKNSGIETTRESPEPSRQWSAKWSAM